MKWSLVLWGMAISTILSLCAWGAVLFVVNPENATAFEWFLFFSPFLLALCGIFAMAILFVRKMIGGHEHAMARVGTSFRQGTFLSVFVIGLLFLERRGWLAWWDAIFVFVFLFLIELFFLRRCCLKES